MAKKQQNKLDFSDVKVLVIGDIMLDQYVKGAATRISPEAPVPVVLHSSVDNNLGGAGNVAVNLAHLGCQTSLIGLVGQDAEAQIVTDLALAEGIEGVALSTTFPTVTKTRIVANSQQIVRLDREQAFELNKQDAQNFYQIVEALLPFHHVIIVSDYAKGTITKDLMKRITKLAKKNNIPVLVDPKQLDWSFYGDIQFITPNFGEFKATVQQNINNDSAEIAKSGKAFLKKQTVENILVTRSEKGMSLISAKNTLHFETKAQEVFDVSGAGDTVIATFAACIAKGFSLSEAVELANIAAGVVVGKQGTTPISIKELNDLW